MSDTAEIVPAPDPRRAWTLPAEPRSVAVIRSGVREFARDHGAPDDTVANIALAVSEAVTNSVVHAYVGLEPGTINAVVEAGKDEVVILVVDDGRGMQPRPDSPGLGMGLPLIGRMTASVDIRERHDGPGTEVRMTFVAPGVTGPSRAAADPARQAVLDAVTHLARQGGWPGEGVERLPDLVVPAVADGCAVDILDQNGVAHRLAARAIGVTGEDLTEETARIVSDVTDEDSPAARAMQTGQPQVQAQDPETGGTHAALVARLGVRWLVVVPIENGGRPVGLLLLGLRAERGEPDADMLDFAEALASRIGEALANTRLLLELRRTRTRFGRILDVLGEAVTVHDAAGRQVYANDAAARLLGLPSATDVVASSAGELAGRFVITREDGTPVGMDDFPGGQLLAGRPAEPLLTRSINRQTGAARWLLTKATLLEDGDEPLAVNIIEDVTDAKESELRMRFLAQASERLAATLDYGKTLEEVARLLVPEMADWCGVDIATPSGGVERVALAHTDPAKLELGRELDRRYPPDLSAAEGLGAILRGGPSVLFEDIPDELIEQGAQDAEHLRLMREIGLRSVIMAPMRIRERTIGVLTIVNAESGRRFTEGDRQFAEDVARRAAFAVENARLYTELAGR